MRFLSIVCWAVLVSTAAAARAPVDDTVLPAQVMLDRAGFSPGEIDGRMGENTARAIRAYQQANQLPVTGQLDPATSHKLSESLGTMPALVGYAITPDDVEGPFTPRIPADMMQKATLKALGYRVIFHAPVTSGSRHDPLPIGEWKVTRVFPMPTFNYNPALFWDADPTHAKAPIAPGPNNPVGTVWIDLTKEHYGLHGTPEPSRIGYLHSHGCVRLTNWDIQRAARRSRFFRRSRPKRWRPSVRAGCCRTPLRWPRSGRAIWRCRSIA
ncbi:MAG: peptidoglycan-binding protein [Acidobacteria bacterium]|nr:peptidoglycan-binding protein [Acidobacteriota bacterium]